MTTYYPEHESAETFHEEFETKGMAAKGTYREVLEQKYGTKAFGGLCTQEERVSLNLIELEDLVRNECAKLRDVAVKIGQANPMYNDLCNITDNLYNSTIYK